MAKDNDMNEMLKTEEGDDLIWEIGVDSHLFCC